MKILKLPSFILKNKIGISLNGLIQHRFIEINGQTDAGYRGLWSGRCNEQTDVIPSAGQL